MRFCLLLLSMVVLSKQLLGQNNLVPNSSFEDLVNCPNMSGQLWNTSNWLNPNSASPDYFHSCNQPLVFPPDTMQWPHMGVPWNGFGWQNARSGDAYIGIYTMYILQPDAGEYIQVQLMDSIVPSVRYQVSFYVSLADNGRYAINTLGAYLSKEAISSDGVERFDVVPQILNPAANPLTDPDVWVLVTDTFSSRNGGERYLTIGNFNTTATSDTVLYNPDGDVSANYAYYYIDDVSVVAIDSLPSNVEEVTQSGRFKVYPNPSHGRFNVEYRLGQGELGTLQVFNDQGSLHYSQQLISSANVITTVDLDGLSSGLYLLVVTVNGERRYAERISLLKE